MLLNQMLRVTLSNFIASGNPEEGEFLDDNESEICSKKVDCLA